MAITAFNPQERLGQQTCRRPPVRTMLNPVDREGANNGMMLIRSYRSSIYRVSRVC
jgi:hypothetical protein